MKKYSVTGMSCAACSARVEKAVSKVEGVTSVSVSLLTNSMGVEGSASSDAVVAAVEAAGYGAAPVSESDAGGSTASSASGSSASTGSATTAGSGSSANSALEASLVDRDTPRLVRRLCWSVAFVLVLMYFSMGHMMWGWKVPEFLRGNHVAVGLVQLLLCTVVMVINQKFFVNGFKGLLHGAPNMDTLVALGSSVSYGWSVYILFAMTDAQMKGNNALVEELMMKFYFESAAMILALITVGKTLEAYSKGKTTDALKSLLKLAPKTACVLREGKEITVGVEQVVVGDVFLVRPGESIPVDGEVIEGSSAVNESALTGESVPVEKEAGSGVSAGTINTSGFLKCRALHVGNDTALSKIIQMVSDAAATKAPIAKIADRVSGVFVPVVISLAIVVTVIWLLCGAEIGYALARGISVLVISCPCALGLATPVAIMVGNGVGARNGILFKTSSSLEETGKARFVVLDKTGTVTEGLPVVTDVICAGGAAGAFGAGSVSADELVGLACCVEKMSEHPLAKAVVSYGESALGKDGDGGRWKVEEFKALAGNGVEALVTGADFGINGTLGTCGDFETNAALGTDAAFGSGAALGINAALGTATAFGTDTALATSAAFGTSAPSANRKIRVYGGSRKYVSTKVELSSAMEEAVERFALEGKTPLLFAAEDVSCGTEYESGKAMLLGVIAVADTIKVDSAKAVQELKDMSLEVYMLTGDNEKTAGAIASQAGIENVIANVLPQDKESAVRKLQEKGKVIMVGDGINDAPALARADIGMAIGTGTDVAIDAADVVLMHSSLRDVVKAVKLSRKTLVNIKENLFWAFIYNLIGIPLAAGAFIPVLGWELNPMFGAAAMSLSSFCVVTNALRLNLVKLGKKAEAENAVAERNAMVNVKVSTEENKMTKTIKVEGMMCAHCEGHVKKALEALDGVTEAVASHDSGTATVTLSKDVDAAVLTKAVEDAGYKVLGVE